MNHKTMLGGTLYDVVGGKTMVGGTVYGIDQGTTMIAGTTRHIDLASLTTISIRAENVNQLNAPVKIEIDGKRYVANGTWEMRGVKRIYCGFDFSNDAASVYVNNVYVGNSYEFKPTTEFVDIYVPASIRDIWEIYVTTS